LAKKRLQAPAKGAFTLEPLDDRIVVKIVILDTAKEGRWMTVKAPGASVMAGTPPTLPVAVSPAGRLDLALG
jgi:hypothetical protein